MQRASCAARRWTQDSTNSRRWRVWPTPACRPWMIPRRWACGSPKWRPAARASPSSAGDGHVIADSVNDAETSQDQAGRAGVPTSTIPRRGPSASAKPDPRPRCALFALRHGAAANIASASSDSYKWRPHGHRARRLSARRGGTNHRGCARAVLAGISSSFAGCRKRGATGIARRLDKDSPARGVLAPGCARRLPSRSKWRAAAMNWTIWPEPSTRRLRDWRKRSACSRKSATAPRRSWAA